ncbi:MAG TPA: ISL3 family transposase [Gemmataceae bacterium]|jgi:transposase|nr:ISL3 family transposase [Gemmataceae bacterium]
MSTSLLYHGFGLVGYRYVRQDFREGRVIFRIEQPRERWRCPDCGSAEVWGQGGVERTFRLVPIGPRPALLSFKVPRVYCFDCQRTRQVKLGFADPNKHYTRAFERYVLELSRHMTIQDVAQHLQVSWDTVKDIQARSLQRRFGKPRLHKLKQIAIDEIAIGKGHHYLTVVLNLLSGAVVFVGDGKGAEALAPFWKRLRRARAKVEAVATDMSAAYTRAVRENLPRAVHVFDHFHVIKLFNDKLSAFRRELYHQAQSDHDRQILKGTRWLLLKNPENLDRERDELRRLEQALRLNTPLATAYFLKEDLRQIWMQPNKRTARRVLRDWLARARVSGIRMLSAFADTLETHQEGILAYYDYRISTGALEGTNTKIQAMKRQAYGFRDHEFFKLKILGIHEARHALVG